MNRCAIYARYSTDMQSEASLDDQVRECRELADRNGWEVVAVYTDAAISGGSDQRREYQQMLQDAALGRFDIVVAEALDRISRRLSDSAKIFDQLSFHGVRIYTKNEQEITKMQVAFVGLMADQFVADLREKTKRGQRGRVLQGKTAGGLGFGYRVGDVGERVIVDEEAEIVRRVLNEYACGLSPREIAKRLNEEGISGPRGRKWKNTTIRGQRARGTGLLNNRAYVGQLVYGRTQYKTDPNTRRRVAIPKPEEEWEIVEVPSLRIVDEELWEAVRKRQTDVETDMPRDDDGNALNRAHRKKHVFSGLLRCGCCGGPMAITAKDRYGCSNYRTSRSCTNSRTIKRKEVEDRVLAGLKMHLLDQDLVEEFLVAYQEELNAARAQSVRSQQKREKRLAEITRKIDRLLDAIEDGINTPSSKQRLKVLDEEREQLLRDCETVDQEVVPLPTMGRLYADRVNMMMDGLTDPVLRQQAIELLHSMIDHITVTPLPDGHEVELHGELGAILGLVSQNSKSPVTSVSGHSHSVVAGVGFEPTTFRL